MTERPAQCCPDCGRPTNLVRKGRPLARCGPCHRARLLQCHRDWEQQHQDERRAYQQARKARRVPYQAWRTLSLADGRVLVCRARGHCVSRVYVVQGSACSCGQGRCVHMVVALLARQQEGRSDE
jgi:cysteine sulfinate desulfinase/cysteine desulfurase-like protein